MGEFVRLQHELEAVVHGLAAIRAQPSTWQFLTPVGGFRVLDLIPRPVDIRIGMNEPKDVQ